MKLFDTTIRDGSYAVDFKWTKEDIIKIIAKIERLGFEYIEIGHGLGLNASSHEHGVSLLSDVQYMALASKTLSSAKFGFFCIPDIARIDDLHIAKDNGASFVRVGVNVDAPEQAFSYIREAKKLGLETMTNYMKSYAVSPNNFAAAAAAAADNGADCVYIVDSAGCMLQDDIEKFATCTKKITDVKLGFHGHNNLGLAVSNSIACVKLGFDFVDCTLQGLGRSIGNAPSEQLVMALQKLGFCTEIDIPCLLEWGYDCIKDVTERKLLHPLDLISGYTGFHSSFLKDVYKCCDEKHVDPLRLIIAYCRKNRIAMDYELLKSCADSLHVDNDVNPYSFRKFFSEMYSE